MMRLILDASAAIEVALNRAKAREFAALLGDAAEVLAPELLVPEVVNTVWKYHQFEKLSLLACDRTIELALSLVDALVSCKELYREAFLLARTTQRPAYDGFYLALAQREDAALLTVDGALKREALRQGIRTL
jgi:predicted nucleic acid-binding protein